MIFLRLLVRLLGVVWVLALALLALGVAAYCLDGAISLGSLRPDHLVGLGTVHHRVGRFLDQVAAPGPTAFLSLLCGVGAMLLGLIVLIGVLRRSKERLALLEDGHGVGSLAARAGTLREMLRALARQPRQASAIDRPRLSLARHGTGGRVTISAKRSATSDPKEIEQAVKRALTPLTEPFSLKQRVRVSRGGRGERVR